jgi:hypothetical protein
MDPQTEVPVSNPTHNFRNTIITIIFLIIALSLVLGLYYFLPKLKKVEAPKPSSIEERIQLLESLRVSPTADMKELSAEEKTQILKNLNPKPVATKKPAKDEKLLTETQKQEVINSLE